MGSRRRIPRSSHDESQLGNFSVANDITSTRRESIEDKLVTEEFVVRRRRSSQLPYPLHPSLTDFGPASFALYLEQELAKLKQLATRIGHQQEEELREFARALVNSKHPIYQTEEAGHKTFSITAQEDASTMDKGKKPVRKEKERPQQCETRTSANDRAHEQGKLNSLRSSVRRAAINNRTTPLIFNSEPSEMTDIPLLKQSPQTNSNRRRSRGSRVSEIAGETIYSEAVTPIIDQDLATSFETHASQSRDTSRSDERAIIDRNGQPESRRRRKTPVQAQSSLSRSIWASSQSRPGPNAASLDGSPGSWQSPDDIDYTSFSTPYDSSNLFSSTPFDNGPDFTMVDIESDDDLDTQTATMASFQENIARDTYRNHSKLNDLTRFDYSTIAPEDIPADIRQAKANRSTIWKSHGFDENGKLVTGFEHQREDGLFSKEQLDPTKLNWLRAPDILGEYPRVLSPKDINIPRPQARRKAVAPKTGLPYEVWEADTGKSPGGVLQYLSSTELRNLRLVCRSLAEDLEPYVFRNVVTKFAPQLFSLRPTYSQDGKLELDQSASMLHRFGSEINKFGITFDYDEMGLVNAPFKVTETVVNAWFGRYTWPVKDYPYFTRLREIDKLLDDERRLLTLSLKKLTNCRELAISLDSGHGWLSGPDLSDLAIYRDQAKGGSRVFGRTYDARDRNHDDGMKRLFKWAQLNTLNENIKVLDGKSTTLNEECSRLKSITVRDYDSFRKERTQPDYTASLHTGGVPGIDQWAQLQAHVLQAQAQNQFQPQNTFLQNMMNPATLFPPQPIANPLPRRFQAVMGLVQANTAHVDPPKRDNIRKPEAPIQPQWPIIFNGYNISTECRGDSAQVQNRIANPVDYPLHPSSLTEPQAQWLMETSWIQKSFLSAYMDAVRLNTHVLRNVHSLHLSKISSGLLPQLLQKEFWSCLKGLRKVTLLVKPDWRVEHTPGDKFFQTNMAAEPITAAYKFADVLKDCIAPLENLNSLHIGYLGGGEHQTGIFGRNQHILPAPITQTPRSWLIAQNTSNPKPHSNTIITFPHVRTLRFENCWFSPLMLEEFMVKSRDTSLHNLILDSVSLTAQVNSTRTDGPLRTADHNLKCQYGVSAWLSETLPVNAAWTQVLDKITPGKTLLDRKYDEGLIDVEQNPRPESSFRGNIQQISLKSCGYVKILGIPSNEFNQNELVYQHSMWSAMDDGLKLHANKFMRTLPNDSLPEISSSDDRRGNNNTVLAAAFNQLPAARVTLRVQPKEPARTIQRPIMLSGRPAHMRAETISTHDENAVAVGLTGYLTQCVHPVEKRVLEQNWGMKFGWGDDMQRWEAVEDGWFIGGTGRFGGDVFRDDLLQRAVLRPVEEDQLMKNSTHIDLTTETGNEDGMEAIAQPTQADPSSRNTLAPEFFDASSESEGEVEVSQTPETSRRRRVRLRFPSSRQYFNVDDDQSDNGGRHLFQV